MVIRSRWMLAALLGFAVMVRLVVGGSGSGQPPAANPAPRWEYKVVITEGNIDPNEKYLNKLGDDGWELVSANIRDAAPLRFLLIFKRPKPK